MTCAEAKSYLEEFIPLIKNIKDDRKIVIAPPFTAISTFSDHSDFEYFLTGGINRKILYFNIYPTLSIFLGIQDYEIRSILKMEKFGIFWWRSKNFY